MTLFRSAQEEDVMQQVQNGQYRIAYITPKTFYEKMNQLSIKVFLRRAREGKLSVVAVNEARHISSWQSFR